MLITSQVIMQRKGPEIDLQDPKKNEVPGMIFSLYLDTITTYWLGYDRNNMVVKYGKWYAITFWKGS